MAFYVLLLKEQENDKEVVYQYGPEETCLGRITLSKADGSVTELEPAPGGNSEDLFIRAAMKVRQHWRDGVFPDKSCWAS